MQKQPIAERMAQIPFSTIRSMFEQVNQLEQQGQNIIHLEMGRPDFDTPEHIKAACCQAINNSHVHYTSNYGLLELRKAIAAKLSRDNNLDFNPKNEVIVTAGVSEGIMATMMALLNPEDEVLICEPVFPAYEMAARMAGATPIYVPITAENQYQPTIAALTAKLSNKTKMLIITTPNNPTGTVMTQQTLQALADFAISHDLLVMADEIYEKLIYEDQKHISIASLPNMRARTITLNGFSKSYAMTGWRLGYIAADQSLIQAIIRIHQNTVVCSNSFAQWGGIAALNGPQQPLIDMVNELDRRRMLLINQLAQIPDIHFIRPQGAMYVYIDISKHSDDAHQLAEQLLTKASIAVTPWDQHHIRLSYGNSYGNLQQAMQRLGNFLTTTHP